MLKADDDQTRCQGGQQRGHRQQDWHIQPGSAGKIPQVKVPSSQYPRIHFIISQPCDPSHNDLECRPTVTRVPFYIAMPMSTLDRNCPTGQNIPIEQVRGLRGSASLEY